MMALVLVPFTVTCTDVPLRVVGSGYVVQVQVSEPLPNGAEQLLADGPRFEPNMAKNEPSANEELGRGGSL